MEVAPARKVGLPFRPINWTAAVATAPFMDIFWGLPNALCFSFLMLGV